MHQPVVIDDDTPEGRGGGAGQYAKVARATTLLVRASDEQSEHPHPDGQRRGLRVSCSKRIAMPESTASSNAA